MDNYTLNDFKNALSANSKRLFEFVYKEYYPKIKGFIIKNKGSAHDAKDVFQEAIMAVIKNIGQNTVDNNVLFWSYLLSVSKHIWLNQLRRPCHQMLNEDDLNEYYNLNEEDILNVEDSIEMGIFQRNFKKLDDTCKKLLKSYLKEVPLKKIAIKLGLKSENNAKKRKHKCKERLIQLIKEDPDYKIFMKDKKI